MEYYAGQVPEVDVLVQLHHRVHVVHPYEKEQLVTPESSSELVQDLEAGFGQIRRFASATMTCSPTFSPLPTMMMLVMVQSDTSSREAKVWVRITPTYFSHSVGGYMMVKQALC